MLKNLPEEELVGRLDEIKKRRQKIGAASRKVGSKKTIDSTAITAGKSQIAKLGN